MNLGGWKEGEGRSGRARNVISLLCSKLGGKKRERERRAGKGGEEMARRQEGKGDEWRAEQDALKTGLPPGLLCTQGSRETAINPALGSHST